jgi:general stress protein CsbA
MTTLFEMIVVVLFPMIVRSQMTTLFEMTVVVLFPMIALDFVNELDIISIGKIQIVGSHQI